MSTMLPTSWMPRPAGLLPSDATRYDGPAVAYWITTILLVVITARSLVHLFSPDGGAHSIATIDTSVAGGDNIIAIFGQWGASQLLLVGALWVLLHMHGGFRRKHAPPPPFAPHQAINQGPCHAASRTDDSATPTVPNRHRP